MNALYRQGETALWYLLGGPSSRTEGLVLAALFALSAVLVMGRMERATNIPRSGPLMTLAVTLFGIVSVLFSYVLLSKFVAPFIGVPHGYPANLVGSMLVSALVIVPAICIIQKAPVRAGLISWGASLSAAMFVVIIARTGFDVIEAGSERAQASKARSSEVEKFIDNPLKEGD